MRYINKQRDGYSCGAIAFINALKWLGFHHTAYADLWPICRQDMSIENGTEAATMSRWLRKYQISYRRINYPTVRILENALRNNYSIILAYKHFVNCGDGDEGHFCFIDEHDDTRFVAHNVDCKREMLKKNLRENFRRSKKENWDVPIAWIIKRKS